MIHLDGSRRDEAIDAGWLAYKERTPEHESAYRAMCADWRAVAVCSGDEVIGALLEKDGVIQCRTHVGKRIVLAMDMQDATYMAVWTGNYTSDVFAVTPEVLVRWKEELPPS